VRLLPAGKPSRATLKLGRPGSEKVENDRFDSAGQEAHQWIRIE
jgi:hypothetical protein